MQLLWPDSFRGLQSHTQQQLPQGEQIPLLQGKEEEEEEGVEEEVGRRRRGEDGKD